MKKNKTELLALFESEIESLLEASAMGARGEYRLRANAESPERVTRAKGLKFSKFQDVKLNDGKQMVIRFETASSNYDETGETYINLIVIPGLTQAYKTNPSYASLAGAIRNSDVQVKCNCKDFKYRYEYWVNKNDSLAKVGDASEQYAINNKPNVTNPNDDQGPFCKHLIAVTGVFLPNLSGYTKYIKAMDLDSVVEPLAENEERAEGMIVLKKEDDEFLPAILGTPDEISEKLEKDSGLTEAEREEVKEVLTKEEPVIPAEEEEPEELEREEVVEIEPEESDEVELAKDTGELEPEPEVELEKDSGVESGESEVELEKDKHPLDSDELL